MLRKQPLALSILIAFIASITVAVDTAMFAAKDTWSITGHTNSNSQMNMKEVD